jgi:LysR family glycine cleavage system transcriptional activator
MSKLRSLVPSTHSLFVFEAAARNLSFKRAAMELNVTQPSISHGIKALEKHAKVRLFARDNRGVRLTDSGRQLYEEVRDSFRRLEQSLQDISDKGTKYLTFAASTSIAAHWLAPQLYNFQEAHPDIKIKVVATDRDVDPDHEIDATIWVRRRDFKRENIWFITDEIVFPVCSPAYLASHGKLDCVDDIRNHKLIHSSDTHRKRMSWPEWFDMAGGDASQIETNIVFNDHQLAFQAAIAGEGVALGWSLICQYLLKNRLLVRPLATETQTGRAFFLVANNRPGQSEKLKVLIDWVLAQSAELRG